MVPTPLWRWRLAFAIIATQVLVISLTASEATGCAVEPASSPQVHYCCFFCSQKSEPRLPRISFEEIQKRYSR
jgi:hypothetical protein